MKDILKDIVAHTHDTGLLDMVKITGTEEKTFLNAMAENRTVIMEAETIAPHPDMIGVFGMSQMSKLKYNLECPEYKEGAEITIQSAERNGETVPTGLHFENKAGDFKNDYRFMNTEVINEKMKTVKFRGVKWDVTVKPSVAALQRFHMQVGANSEHPSFLAKTDNGNLKFIFGDASTHGGEFVFETGISGKLDRGWTWPVVAIASIFKAASGKELELSISNEGALQITIDSGLATYKYIIPANT